MPRLSTTPTDSPGTDPFRLDGRVALISGGATGLGYGMAEAIVQAGGKVVLLGRREDKLRSAVERLGSSAACETFDVTKSAKVDELVTRVVTRFQKIDILVNNAGVHDKREFTQTSLQDFDKVLQTHVYGSFALTRAVVPVMLGRGSGHVLFITSMSAFIGMPKIVAYSAAKSAFLGMVRGLAAELSPLGIRVNGIAPGWIESEMLHKAIDDDPERKAKILGRTPMARFGKPEDIGRAAVFLSSDAAAFINGVILPVDGGASSGF
jgi:NAD(P)-dependent dehydrogenase (short-subunit alcohol dehydrogenase family)